MREGLGSEPVALGTISGASPAEEKHRVGGDDSRHCGA